MTVGDILKIILAFILPPLAVATQVGFTGAFWLNLPFWLVGICAKWLPMIGLLLVLYPIAIIHAIYIILARK
ncbi:MULTISPECIES: YqaE/Pmp3 family membrane protein [unclassified Synechococcus]|uniref:YqaE/Pmp3 family membrane protein n=1 Tax=unclassified Synechococcus TaxID=2626047 RepID=UPI0008FF1064|nr:MULTISPECIES: YqaE/Pmp3 family membrane protein [unclassified Synechococcus]APD49257.1 salt-stress induced hydrophobic peptide [Synechococcus sp. SynAce01]MCT0247240.1 YqaE/Pmp3 family membrane protein [Synechococcus sp. CS-601]TWB96535.1 proteolipid membrane potential modulator [Synechococcus sp. Ace-Pa]